MLDDPCSRFLPRIYPAPPPSELLASLSRLTAFLNPPNTLVDLRIPLPVLADVALPAGEVAKVAQEEEQEDDFERGFARSWLERVVAIASKALARGADEFELWEKVVDGASGLLAVLSGPSAQGSSSKTYLLPAPRVVPYPSASPPCLPPTPPPSHPASTSPSVAPSPRPASPIPRLDDPLSLTIRDTTLLQNSTGHRTWGSAPILAQRMASLPWSFFPLSAPTASPPRILELGSGTGLVGLSAAAVLSRLSPRSGSSVTLTDGGPEPAAVLDNLAANVAANAESLAGVEIKVEQLDWREFLPPSSPGGQGRQPRQEERYDVLLAADVAYEPGMAEALHAAVCGLLRFPSSTSPPPSPATFHLIIPLRRTHTVETATVERLFPPSASAVDPALVHTAEDGRRFRLVATEREELIGPDGFGGGGARGRGRGRAEGEMRYLALRVEWAAVH
ncbi:hypothetical protein JCM10213_006293 [Rhodosporidiobolus nylandii]